MIGALLSQNQGLFLFLIVPLVVAGYLGLRDESRFKRDAERRRLERAERKVEILERKLERKHK